jgi:hypothetical protein
MRLGIERLIFHENRPYRYRVYNGDGDLLWIADREEPWRIYHTRRIHFRTPAGEPVGRLEPPPDLPWVEGTTYYLLTPDEQPPSWSLLGSITQRYTPAADLMQRLPDYEMEFSGRYFVARGSRYADHLYEIFEGEPPQALATMGPVAEQVESLAQVRLRRILSGAEMLAAATEKPARRRKRSARADVAHPIEGFTYEIGVRSRMLGRYPLMVAALVVLVDMEIAETPAFRTI